MLRVQDPEREPAPQHVHLFPALEKLLGERPHDGHADKNTCVSVCVQLLYSLPDISA